MANTYIKDYQEIRRKWKDMHGDSELRKKELIPEIMDSWERSYQYNIPRFTRECSSFCMESEYKEALERSQGLIEISLPVAKGLQEFVAGTGFIIAITDANSVVLNFMGDKHAMEWAQQARLGVGSMWAEDVVGTNALSLCTMHARPFSIYAYEHFSLYCIVGSCSFAPIIDNGRVVGSIGMLAPYEKVSHHTLGMVVAGARHIESAMVLNRISKYHQVVMESMSDGVLVVDSNSAITYMNKICSKIFGLYTSNVIGLKVYDVLGNDPDNHYFIDILSQGRAVTDELIVVSNGKAKIKCHITCTPLHSSNPYGKGTVIIIRENERIDSLVGKWLGRSAKMTFDDVIGSDPKFKHVINMTKSASSSSSNVLLLGESGTGKDIVAQAMHNESPRKNNPFVAINCAALPRELIASELFGYEDGAFTGAKKGGNIGKFELANQGTIFLDEIGDVPIDMQVTLLRVLEEKCVIRLGGTKLIPVNVRIIAATNKNLEEEIELNRFRRDLYYRLGVLRFKLPPLRERQDDILVLADHFLHAICQRFGKSLKKLTPETERAFLSYDWPGNVREMQNILEGAVQLAAGDEINYEYVKDYLHVESLSPYLFPDIQKSSSVTIADMEHQMILNYLEKNNYNKNETAKALGMSRRTFFRRLNKYGLLG